MKRQRVETQLFPTENEFAFLLQIHNEIKLAIAQIFTHIRPKLIDNLFTILSSQALLYDQILRKGITPHNYIKKQTQMGKLLQGNKNTLEKHINGLFSSLITNFCSPLKRSQSDTFTILSTIKNSSFLSPDDSLLNLEQESVVSRLKRKMKMEKSHNHMRTNSVCGPSQIIGLEMKKKQRPEKEKQAVNTSSSVASERSKPIEKTKRPEKQRNSISHTYSNYNTNNAQTYSNINTINKSNTDHQQFNTIAGLNEEKDRKEREKKEKAPRIVFGCQAFPEIVENKNSAKPSAYAKNLLKKYKDIVGAFEKIDSDEETENKRSESNTIRLNINCTTKTKACETSRAANKISIPINNKLFSPIANNTNSNAIPSQHKKEKEKEKEKEKKPVSSSKHKEKKLPMALKF